MSYSYYESRRGALLGYSANNIGRCVRSALHGRLRTRVRYMFGKFRRGVGRCWWALVAGGRATRRSFEAWGRRNDRFFEPLTPVLVEQDRAARYERELLRALHDEEVLNIAITGGYGAGKSSVLKTFFVNRPGFLRHFPGLVNVASQTLPVTADC
jgi:hypothetical protein